MSKRLKNLKWSSVKLYMYICIYAILAISVVTELSTIKRYFAPCTKVSENATNEIRLRVLRKRSDKDSLSNLIRLYIYHTRTVCHQDKSIDRWNGVAEYL